ncbi:hypothetical protein C2G38_2048894 [Gigaspora rosea]|uniref:Uncharacterized protein n=1 Tax=Gigaspora rosea TaxID=44941 RepID=A0A397U2L8_9GLOM|nr:hypothetical protein C2G38_2048894 [Gigaspora rosea]
MGEEFGIMKKTLNLAIAAGRVEELYEIHKNFTGQMENKVVSRSGDDHAEFALTINNPVSVRTKGRPKGSNNVNSNIKGKSNQDTRENRVGRPRKVLQEVALNVSESSKSKEENVVFVIKEGIMHVLVLKGVSTIL